ncbi:MAG: PIN domain-containing protein [Chitinispirillales bacterium]|jgi:predicted nucleic acid-binding protein|nr:PIN domain-containing protein [Chitinispirillales bacterium]
MNVLIDTDVLIDFLTDREPFTVNAKEVIRKVRENIITAYLAPHSITNIFFILRKLYSATERRQSLIDLCRSVTVAEVKAGTIFNTLENMAIDDIEDGLQAECAISINADYIVTRNIRDYAKSKVPAILPEELLKKI